MFRFKRGIAAAMLAVAMVFGNVSAGRAAPLEAFGRLPQIEDAQLSPSGSMIAYSLTDGENRAIVIRQVSDGKVLGGLRAGDTKVRDIRWAGDEFLLVTQSQTAMIVDIAGPKREYQITVVYDLATGKQRGLMERAENAMNVVQGIPSVRMVDGERVAIVEGVHFVNNIGRLGLFRVNLRTGGTRLIEPGFQYTDDWVAGPYGEALAQSEYEQRTGEWRLRFHQGSSWKVAVSSTFLIEGAYISGLGRDKQSVLVIDDGDNENPLVRELTPGQSEPRTVPIEAFDELIRDPASDSLIGWVRLTGDVLGYHFFNPQDEAVWKGILKAYGGEQVRLVSWSHDRRKLIVRVDSRTDGPALALVDLDRKTAVWLGDIYSGIKRADVSEVRAITYKAADGLEISGYLTLPRGRDPKGLPLVVLPHGGPASRDEPGFDWWAQALASRGYAVLQPNFRGSAGFGFKFLEAGYGEFGRKMQTDLSDGVRDLAAKGIIDPKRVCIVGASYGGYAALAGPTLDPGVYRCAASVSGISDLGRFMESRTPTGAPRDNSTVRYWSRFFGTDGRNDPDLAALSPATHAAEVDVPILLIHGKDDTVVLFNQSQIMFDALRRAGKPVELVTLKREDHYMSRGETRLQMLQALVTFLEKHNPPE